MQSKEQRKIKEEPCRRGIFRLASLEINITTKSASPDFFVLEFVNILITFSTKHNDERNETNILKTSRSFVKHAKQQN